MIATKYLNTSSSCHQRRSRFRFFDSWTPKTEQPRRLSAPSTPRAKFAPDELNFEAPFPRHRPSWATRCFPGAAGQERMRAGKTAARRSRRPRLVSSVPVEHVAVLASEKSVRDRLNLIAETFYKTLRIPRLTLPEDQRRCAHRRHACQDVQRWRRVRHSNSRRSFVHRTPTTCVFMWSWKFASSKNTVVSKSSSRCRRPHTCQAALWWSIRAGPGLLFFGANPSRWSDRQTVHRDTTSPVSSSICDRILAADALPRLSNTFSTISCMASTAFPDRWWKEPLPTFLSIVPPASNRFRTRRTVDLPNPERSHSSRTLSTPESSNILMTRRRSS